jgi:ubiquinol-cytochrome c reductase cytochrome c subunit
VVNKIVATGLAAALITFIPALRGQDAGSNAGNAENGKRLFVEEGCYQCHGYAGQGGGAGPRIAPRPATAGIQYVRRPTGVMPPYTAKVLPDKQLADIRAFLGTIQAPPPVKNIPLLNQ